MASCFLPGTDAPDKILKDNFGRLDQEAVARELRVDRQDLLVAAASAAGVDFHDWARTVSRALNLEQPTFVKGVTKVWIREDDALPRQFVAAVKQALQ